MSTQWRSRAGLTALAFVLVPAAGFELALGWAFTTLGLVLGVFVVGTPVLAALTVVRRFAAIERFLASRTLGTPVTAYYRTRSGSRWRRSRTVLGDPATWRDLVWAFVSATYGVVLCVIVLALFGGMLWYAVFPLLWYVTPEGIFAVNYGVFRIDSQRASFIGWAFAIVLGLLWWFLTPPLMRLRARAARLLLRPTEGAALRQRVEQLATTRAEAVDASATELRRIERDLHDGVQARLVALSINLGMAEEMLDVDPAAARTLIAEARAATSAGLEELRGVVRGIHPPVLADRGLVGAVQAAVLASPVDTAVSADGVGRLPAPVESAVYFAVAELLTNVARHSGASRAQVELAVVDGRVRASVEDDGRGGARFDGTDGTGLSGLQRRLGAFDGTIDITSPAGGPTRVVLEVPCG